MIPAILLTAACFIAAILNLALDTRFKGRVMGVSAACAVALGIVFYGGAFAWAGGLSAATVLRALLAVCRMFGGVNDFSAVTAAPFFSGELAVTLFWAGHFLAFYVTASAAIAVLGQRLLKTLRIQLLRRGSLALVYATSPDALRLVKRDRTGRSLVVVTDRDSAAIAPAATTMGGVIFEGGAALCADPDFLRRIGVGSGRRELEVYCVGDDAAQNLRCAEAVLDALKARRFDAAQASLFLLGTPETRAVRLLASEGRYGYGTLVACTRYELAARLAIRRVPPWTLVRFDAEGSALEDLRVVIVGFGQMGRAMLRHLIMFGQFEGGHFHAEVFDPRIDALSGPLRARYPELLSEYDVALRADSGESAAFYQRLQADPPAMIALCTGSPKYNSELALELERFYAVRREKPPILQCAADGVIVGDVSYPLGDVEVKGIDRRAMVLNHVYCAGPSAEADWRACDPFSRASCRASVDFYPAFLHIAGVDPAHGDHWPPAPAVLENLGRTEHRRWCAFHLTMGYRPMSDAEFDARAARYRRGEPIRIGKDTDAMTHACLVPWEALDALAEREREITGSFTNYKAMDIDNVLAVPEILRLDDSK